MIHKRITALEQSVKIFYWRVKYVVYVGLIIDASGDGLDAVLYQEQDGKQHVIAYARGGLHSSECNYPAHQLEILALKWTVCAKLMINCMAANSQ